MSTKIFQDSGIITDAGRPISDGVDAAIKALFADLKSNGVSNPEIALLIHRAIGDAQLEDALASRNG